MASSVVVQGSVVDVSAGVVCVTTLDIEIISKVNDSVFIIISLVVLFGDVVVAVVVEELVDCSTFSSVIGVVVLALVVVLVVVAFVFSGFGDCTVLLGEPLTAPVALMVIEEDSLTGVLWEVLVALIVSDAEAVLLTMLVVLTSW